MQIMFNNLTSILLNPQFITEKLKYDLSPGRVIPAIQSYPFISSCLGLVPKFYSESCCIHHLCHPQDSSVNDFIIKEGSNLDNSSIKNVTDIVLQAGHHCVIFKKDIKEAFCNIPVVPHTQWPLGFS